MNAILRYKERTFNHYILSQGCHNPRNHPRDNPRKILPELDHRKQAVIIIDKVRISRPESVVQFNTKFS